MLTHLAVTIQGSETFLRKRAVVSPQREPASCCMYTYPYYIGTDDQPKSSEPLPITAHHPVMRLARARSPRPAKAEAKWRIHT
eukprot:5859727-Amphidinium_carterae.2